MLRRLSGFWRAVAVAGLLLLGGTLLSTHVEAQQGGTNLLVNGDFEWGSANNRTWPFQDAIPEVQVCPGWRAFYVDKAPAKASAPTYWRRPEFRDVKASDYANRVRTGLRAAKYFSFGGQHEAGFYQQVGGIEPGTALRFAAFMQTWSCLPGPNVERLPHRRQVEQSGQYAHQGRDRSHRRDRSLGGKCGVVAGNRRLRCLDVFPGGGGRRIHHGDGLHVFLDGLDGRAVSHQQRCLSRRRQPHRVGTGPGDSRPGGGVAARHRTGRSGGPHASAGSHLNPTPRWHDHSRRASG